ncbi:hypothetical protein LOC51_02390 [Rubrivivax sp. JA1024]|nr:hypothetical protein [Rubrivivax sp. JA1024]
MPVRLNLSAALFAASIVSASAAGSTPATVTKATFACPSMGMTNEVNALKDAKKFDAAFAAAKEKGCKPMLAMISEVQIIHGGDEAKCVVPVGEMGPCLWMPASMLKVP